MEAYLYIMDYRDKSCIRRGPMGRRTAEREADDLTGAILAISCAVLAADAAQPTTSKALGCLFDVAVSIR